MQPLFRPRNRKVSALISSVPLYTRAALFLLVLLISVHPAAYSRGSQERTSSAAPRAGEAPPAGGSPSAGVEESILEISFTDGSEVRSSFYSRQRLVDLGSPVTIPLPGRPAQVESPIKEVTAVTLGELLPLTFEVWRLEAIDRQGLVSSLYPDEISEYLFETYVIPEPAGTLVITPEMILHDIVRIEAVGESLPAAPLEVWVSWEGTDHLKQILTDFADDRGMEIRVHDFPSTASKLIAHNRGGMQVPDLVLVKSDDIPLLNSEQAVQPWLWPLPASIQSTARTAFTVETLAAVPFYSDVQVICWNPEIIPHPFGSPDRLFSGTLGDLEAALDRVPPEYYPAAWNIYSAYWLFPYTFAFGKEGVLEADRTLLVNDDPTVAAVEYLISLIDLGLAVPMERDGMTAQFIQGRTGLIMTGSYALQGFEKLGIPFEIAPYPLAGEPGYSTAPMLDYKGFVIPRKSRNPIAARRIIQYLLSQRVQSDFCLPNMKNPVRDEVWTLGSVPSGTREVLRESIARGAVIPPYPAYGIAKDTLWKMLRLVLDRQIGVQEGLDAAQQIIDNQLARFGSF